jgi:hypothetical protein
MDDHVAAIERDAAVNALRAAALLAEHAGGDEKPARVLGARLDVVVIVQRWIVGLRWVDVDHRIKSRRFGDTGEGGGVTRAGGGRGLPQGREPL